MNKDKEIERELREREREREYEFIGGGDNGVDHVANAVALKEAVLVGSGLVLKVLHYQPLQTLHLLVSRPSHLQQRRRHLLLSFSLSL